MKNTIINDIITNRGSDRKMEKVIAVSTNKGGVLKTSITTNLAGVLAREGKKVLIIDTDNQGNAAITFGKNPDNYEVTLYDVLLDGIHPNKAIQNLYENIDILPSNDDMGFFEFDVVSQLNKYNDPLNLLKIAIDLIKENYDVIIIDCPPNLGLVLGNVLKVSNEVVIPFQPEVYSMRSLQKILKQISDFKVQHNPSLKVSGVIGTLVDGRSSLHSQILQECRRFCFEKDITMFETIIPKSVRFANAVAYEKLPAILVENRTNNLINAYYDLYEEVFNRWPEKTEA
ncbi:ParA family protein [Fictibacillus sp. 7GRE50]|uniref:ParA family protein n=1 Tax=Fictibacillus sp. 7GRE50 TaxID=2745878 RepID=UPI001E3210F9|nr:ParA family protein [Fictibacillus sp. 7GRE50]